MKSFMLGHQSSSIRSYLYVNIDENVEFTIEVSPLIKYTLAIFIDVIYEIKYELHNSSFKTSINVVSSLWRDKYCTYVH